MTLDFFTTGMSRSNTIPASAASELEGTSGKIQVNGVDLYFERYGDGPHALLFIPGALGSVQSNFPPQMEYFGRLGSGFTAVSYDPRGYGKSRPYDRKYLPFPEPHFYETDAHDAVGVMQKLGYSEFSLMGWCDGGVCAVIAAAKHPQLVKNLVIWGSISYISKTDVELFEGFRNVANWNPSLRVATEKVYGGDFSELWCEWMDAFVGIHFDPNRKGDLCTKELTQVKCPSLVVHGGRDPVRPKFHADFLSKQLPNCRYVTYPEGKHHLHLQYSAEFNKLVSDFLNENS